MREIKFRAWDKKINIFGKVVSIDMDDSEWFKERHAGHSGRVSLENPKNIQDCGSWGRWIDSVDLEQYVNKKDNLDIEIFEGDIVKFNVSKAGFSENEKQYFNEIGAVEIKDSVLTYGKWTALYCNNVRVIGNIHENPELLKS